MNTVAEKVASYLLDIKAIKLEPTHPFNCFNIRLPGLPDGNPRSIVIIGRRCLILKFVHISKNNLQH